MKSLRSRAIVYSLIIVLGLLCAAPNLFSASFAQKLPAWMTGSSLALGLDLSGGSHLLMQVDLSTLLQKENQQLAETLRDQLRELNMRHIPFSVSDTDIVFHPETTAQHKSLADIARPLLRDSKTGLSNYEIETTPGRFALVVKDKFRERLTQDAVDQSLEVLRRRLNESGLVEPSITKQGNDSILVQLPGIDNPQEIRDLIGTTAQMTFHWAAEDATAQQTIILPDTQGQAQYRLEQRVALEGQHVKDARLAFNQETNEPVVSFTLDKAGARRFGDMTQHNIGRQLAVVLDGKVITAPVIRAVIDGGRGEISGSFTVQEANEVALLLRAGALPAPLSVIEERTVGPDLGSDAIKMGISTGIAGGLLVFAFMLVIYGRWGLIACLSLLVNIGLIFGVLSLLRATLTLPGIAGIILSVGMAVDANILINERIREETRRGKKALAALEAGFTRAYSTILDSNITSLIAISLLFLFGSGPVRGFAVALAVGLLISLFTSVSLTRLLMEWRVRRLPKNQPLIISGFKWLDAFSDNTLNFMRGRYLGLITSAILSLASIALFITPGMHYGIDFSGGSVVEVIAPNTSTEHIRQQLERHDLGQATIQEFGETEDYLVRIPMASADQVASGQQVQALKQAILEIAPDSSFPRVEMVGPKVSSDFSEITILAIVFAGLGMLAYLWIRFEYHFALAATLTIGLDLTKTIGFFVLTGVEFNLTAVAALLALLGYSVNDKVVIFDRIRENLRQTPDKPLLQLLNESITSTLTRTVFTSASTFLALIPMAIAGGSVMASFSLPMLFGIVAGTSSSIFIASPILYFLGQRRLRKGLTQLRPAAEKPQHPSGAVL